MLSAWSSRAFVGSLGVPLVCTRARCEPHDHVSRGEEATGAIGGLLLVGRRVMEFELLATTLDIDRQNGTQIARLCNHGANYRGIPKVGGSFAYVDGTRVGCVTHVWHMYDTMKGMCGHHMCWLSDRLHSTNCEQEPTTGMTTMRGSIAPNRKALGPLRRQIDVIAPNR